MLFICDIHGPQSLVGVSNRFADACDGKTPIPAQWVCLVMVKQGRGRVSWHHVDVDVARAAGLEPGQGPLTLVERDQAARKLNDRLLIRKVLATQEKGCRCKECLAEAIEPRHARHLRIPMGAWWPDGHGMPSTAPLHEEEAIRLTAAEPGDFEALLALRIEAMRESLERIGRFDATRARERFLAGFSAEHTRHIEVAGERVGFVVVKPQAAGLLLDHLYILPGMQGQGLGSAVLARIFDEAGAHGAVVRVGALRESDSNRFYLQHGFMLVEQGEFDNYYIWSETGPQGRGILPGHAGLAHTFLSPQTLIEEGRACPPS